MRRLGESIKEHGQLQSVLVRPRGSNYELVVGERRLRACALVGLLDVEAEVKDVDDVTAMELRLIENTQREDLTDAEKGDAVLALWALGKYETVGQIAERIGIYEPTVNCWISKATKLSDQVKNRIQNSELPEDAAYYLRKYPHSVQDKLAQAIIDHKIVGGKSGEHPYREFIKLYDQNPHANLESLANKAKGIETITVPKAELPPKVLEQLEEKKQLAKVQKVAPKKHSKPITKEEAKEHLKKKTDFRFVKARVSHGKAGTQPQLQTEVKPKILPIPETPDYTLCKCALCPLFSVHCKGRCWT